MTGPTAPLTAEEQADRTPAATLPAPLGRVTLPGIDLDVDTMRVLAPQVRDLLIAELRGGAALLREARGTVVVPEDTYELVRRLTAAQEVMTQWSQAFQAAAAEATALMEEEAVTAVGGLPGYEEAPSGSLFVPDGAGQRIAVTPNWKAGETTWDASTLIAWVIDQEAENVSAAGCTCEPPPHGTGPDEDCGEHGRPVTIAREVAAAAIERLHTLGRFTPQASKVEAERKRLAGLQRDSDAAVLRQVRSVGPRQYQGVKVTREDVKP